VGIVSQLEILTAATKTRLTEQGHKTKIGERIAAAQELFAKSK
jgi:hypothetical protein